MTYTVDFLSKKRIKNNGVLPRYYVEDDHEPIIPRETFMLVQEEIARRSSKRDKNGKKTGYSSNHCFSKIIYCAECGEIFRRVHWNNRGKKSIVLRCTSRLDKKSECHARTDERLEKLQAELIEKTKKHEDYTQTAEEILIKNGCFSAFLALYFSAFDIKTISSVCLDIADLMSYNCFFIR